MQVDVVPRLFDVLGPHMRVHAAEGIPLLGLPPARLSNSSLFLKRTLRPRRLGSRARAAGSARRVIVVAIKLDSPGPIHFRQLRMGRGNKTFTILKFRTMTIDAEARKAEVAHLNKHAGGDDRMFKIPHDPRVTRVGRFLRRYSLDELPQLVNVFRGEMSLVGPRPLILDEDQHVDGWARKRLDLKPGITGLWQVLGRDDIPFEEMVGLDYRYVTTLVAPLRPYPRPRNLPRRSSAPRRRLTVRPTGSSLHAAFANSSPLEADRRVARDETHATGRTGEWSGGSGRRSVPGARAAFDQLACALERQRFTGWDPYDALASPLVSAVARTRLMRGVALQGLKRSPVNVRPLLRVPQLEHAKGLALCVSAFAGVAKLEPRQPWLDLVDSLTTRLIGLARSSTVGTGWGYAFDVETRWGSYRAGQPNAVVTSYAAHALLDRLALIPDDVSASFLQRAVRYAIDELLVSDGAETFFGYYKGSSVPIHNANVLVASFVARATEVGSEERALAGSAIAYTAARQRPDGSWPYGEGTRLTWVDGFHTAYVLERLVQWQQLESSTELDNVIRRGTGLFLNGLIDPDGAPRATLSARYPVETHAAASAVTALTALGDYESRATEGADRVLTFALNHLRRRDGRFAFRLGRRTRNNVRYIRWSDSHMLLALANHLVRRT